MTRVAFTPAPDELIACASAFRVFADGLMVKVELPTVRVKLEDELIEVLDGSATVGRVELLTVVVGDPALITFRS